MDISIVIVSWNVKNKLRENLRSIMQSSGASFEVLVVDNNSSDGTIDMLKSEFPSVRLIANLGNLGFAQACNQGIELSIGRYILLLNPDMKLLANTLADTVAWCDAHPQAAVTGIKLISESNELIPQVRRFPSLADQLAIILKAPHLFPGILDSYLRKDFDYSQAARVDSIRGAYFMIRRSTIEKIGRLDERYFLWFEEVDYCRRVADKGLEVWYTPSAQVIDYIGQSFNQVKRSTKQHYFKESMISYFKKWHSSQAFLIVVAWYLGTAMSALGDVFKMKSKTRT